MTTPRAAEVLSKAAGPPPRTFRANATVAVLLGSVAGALNAGGFFAVGVYTSHVTGSWSRVGDELALGHWELAGKFFAFVAAFFWGACTSTLLIEHDTTGVRRQRYLKPLILQIALLGVFVALGRYLATEPWIAPWLTMVLCFTMGLQNAMVTKISGAVVRTTHMTGVVTDMGIETARLALLVRDRWRARRAELAGHPAPRPGLGAFARELVPVLEKEAQKAALLLCILGSFLGGATGGALAFVSWGYVGALPIALVLAALVAFEVTLIRDQSVSSGFLTGPRTMAYAPRADLALAAPPAHEAMPAVATPPALEAPPTQAADSPPLLLPEAPPPAPSSPRPADAAAPARPPGTTPTVRRFRASQIDAPARDPAP